jgi:predicted nucleotidyltransferase
VEFEGELTFDRYTSLWDYLEDSLGVKVDLAIRGSLRPYIEPEAIRVA